MSGKRSAAIISYTIDEDHQVSISKDIIFPQLRTYIKSDDPAWKKYRAYFRRTVNQDVSPRIVSDQTLITPSRIDSIEIDGMIRFYYKPTGGLQIVKTIYPAMNQRLLIEDWQITNVSRAEKLIAVSPFACSQSERGHKGEYEFTVYADAVPDTTLSPLASINLTVHHAALLEGESLSDICAASAAKSRQAFLDTCRSQLVLETPDPIINQLFYFSKIRAAESIYHSSMGLVHSPGGGNYYVGIWANDQVEYSGPFFPYLGYTVADRAAFNTYQKFLENIPLDDSPIPYAFEVDGNYAMTHLDRGDAAMIAYGTSLYALSTGDSSIAARLWPLIEWSIDYCHSQRNAEGAIRSESDEMEGRIETGDANLSTSTLYYGGLMYSSLLAAAMNKPDKALLYSQRQQDMELVIERHFGATMEGLETYRYYDGNTNLRHWICLPLTMGIDKRSTGTLTALFDYLWTDDGVLVQYDPLGEDSEPTYWDRATLYALRGAIRVQETDLALQRLMQYSRERLVGHHVPYPIEAYPENDQRHLSAESALYCRIFIEGFLGLQPQSLTTFSLRPSLPDDWDYLRIDQLHIGGKAIDVDITRAGSEVHIHVMQDGEVLHDTLTLAGSTVIVTLK